MYTISDYTAVVALIIMTLVLAFTAAILLVPVFESLRPFFKSWIKKMDNRPQAHPVGVTRTRRVS